MSSRSPLLPWQGDPVSLKWIMGPSQTALLQFSFSRLFYICLLLCAWALADAQLSRGCKTASQTRQVILNCQVRWTWCAQCYSGIKEIFFNVEEMVKTNNYCTGYCWCVRLFTDDFIQHHKSLILCNSCKKKSNYCSSVISYYIYIYN